MLLITCTGMHVWGGVRTPFLVFMKQNSAMLKLNLKSTHHINIVKGGYMGYNIAKMLVLYQCKQKYQINN